MTVTYQNLQFCTDALVIFSPEDNWTSGDYIQRTSTNVVSFKLVYKEPSSSIILDSAENCSLQIILRRRKGKRSGRRKRRRRKKGGGGGGGRWLMALTDTPTHFQELYNSNQSPNFILMSRSLEEEEEEEEEEKEEEKEVEE